MHHNLLSNFCLLYLTLDTKECFKMLSHLNTLPITKAVPKSFEFYAYQSKRQKSVQRLKEKNQKNQFQLIIINDEDVSFLWNKQKNGLLAGKDGHMTISNKSFCEIMMRNKLLGDGVLIKKEKVLLQSLVWENYIITHREISKQKSFVIFQQIFSSTVINISQNSQEMQVIKKIKLLFEPLLQHLFDKIAQQKLNKFLTNFSRIRQNHPEIIKEIDKEKGILEINFCLLYYYCFSQLLKENDKN